MFSYVYSSAKTYFHLPIDDEVNSDDADESTKMLIWDPTQTPGASSSHIPQHSPFSPANRVMADVLRHDNLYDVLGVPRYATLTKLELRKAYLSRSKACHPDKFPNNPDATHAFQKVAVAYDVLSKPSLKRQYDSHKANYDVFAARPYDVDHAQETFRSVVLGVFNDFLDGDLEVIRTLLKVVNDLNPSLRLSEESVESVLANLQSIRERALKCRTCIYTLHVEITRLIEVQHAFGQLSYLDLLGRAHLTIQLTRIAMSLPVALERALLQEQEGNGSLGSARAVILPRNLTVLINGLDSALERMEKLVKY